jgi:hypothetical protein
MLGQATEGLRLGDLVMNGCSRLASRMRLRVVPNMRDLGSTPNEGFADPREPTFWQPAPELIEARRLIDAEAIQPALECASPIDSRK